MGARAKAADGFGWRRAPLAVLVLLLAGCATTHSLTPVALESDPVVKTRQDPAFSKTGYATFSVFPLSLINPACLLHGESEEIPILFMLRNAFESRGYRYVGLNGSPDLLLTIDVSASKGHTKLPRLLVPPDLSPGGMVPQPQAALAILGGAQAPKGWGDWPPQTQPGYLAPLPGYPPRRDSPHPESQPGFAYVNVSVSIIEAKTGTEVWAGSGAGFSRTPDPKINSQLVLWSLLRQFPQALQTEINSSPAGVAGLDMEVFTNDGKHYYPAVTSVDHDSPGWNAGVKELDMILALDAEPTADTPLSKLRPRLGGPAGSNLTMILWRKGEQVQVAIPRLQPKSAGTDATEELKPAEKPRHLEIPRTVTNQGYIVPLAGAAVLGILIAFGISGG